MSGETIAWIAVAGTALGALIGSASGGVVEFVLDRLREKRAAKVGARLVRVDLALAASQLKAAEDEHEWWVFYSTRMDAWEQHAAALAARLSEEDCQVVTQAVGELKRFDSDMKQAPVDPGKSFRTLSRPESIKALHTMRENATRAYNALSKLGKQTPEKGLLHD